MKLLPLIASTIAAASAAGLRNSNSRDLGLLFDTEQAPGNVRVTSVIEDDGLLSDDTFEDLRD